jgi:hypothetical protein
MRRITLFLLALSAIVPAALNTVRAQGLPTTQPKLITIVREEVKAGRAAGHAKNEAKWVAAYEKAKSPDYYLALTSLTGPNEAWYLVPFESHAAIGASMKREDSDPVLGPKLEKLTLADAEYVSSVKTIQTEARPDLTVGTFPDLSKARFFGITIMRVRPGHEAQFETAVKASGAARMRVAPKFGFRVYQVLAGMPTPTFILYSTAEDYAEFDGMVAAQKDTVKALTADERSAREKFLTEGLLSSEMNRFKLDPIQSYVPKETRAKDPAFWSPK